MRNSGGPPRRSSPAQYVFRPCMGVVFCTTYFAVMAVMALGAPQVPSDMCSNLKNTFSMPNTAINSAQTVPAGTFYPVNPGAGATPVTDLPSFCRVIGTLTPTSDSEIGVEVWMPTAGWNGKLQSVGNHNLGGIIYYGDM